MQIQEAEDREIAREAARQRVLSDFEKTQSIGGSRIANGNKQSTKSADTVDVVAGERGVKRKFELEQNDLDKLVQESEDKALAQLAMEQVRQHRKIRASVL